MNNEYIHSDIQKGFAVEVEAARCSYFDSVRGLTVRQSFYIYGNGRVTCMSFADGKESTVVLSADDEVIFTSMYLRRAA